MPTNTFADSFEAGSPNGVSNIARDSSGRLLSWYENGYICTVARDPSTGLPASLTASKGAGLAGDP